MTYKEKYEAVKAELERGLLKYAMLSNEEYKDKCEDCPYNNTECPGGAWCTIEEY
jgi:hypothetical protein